MVSEVLNTLYVQVQGAYLRLHQDTVRAEVGGNRRLQVPIHHLGGIAVFGNVLLSPYLIHRFAEEGRFVAWFTQLGRFKGRLEGPVSGNVLLRKAQFDAINDEDLTLHAARRFVEGKLKNCRQLLLRGIRGQEQPATVLQDAAERLKTTLGQLEKAKSVNQIRGLEGEAAVIYFKGLGALIRTDEPSFVWRGRTRRPPRDPLNAMLSLAYALITADCASACAGVGLDPQAGYLHVLRPGRPALALDLVEEFRPALADRLVLSLVNRRQIKAKHFEARPGGAFTLSEDGRRVFLEAYQRRKQEEVTHPVIKQRVPLGLFPHIQARLLARYLRGDVSEYVPFIMR